jgi:hypothetical protein
VTRFQNFAARAASALLLLAILIALAAGMGTRAGLWSAALGQFGIFPYGICCAVAAFCAGTIWAGVAFASGVGAGARYGVIAILGAVVLFWVPLRDFWMTDVVHAIPPIHDVSTDTEHAPEFVTLHGTAESGAQFRYSGPRRVMFEGRSYAESALQRLYYGDIKPFWQLGTTANKLYDRALKAAKAMGWRIAAVAPDDRGGRIQATDSTLLFGLTDEIVIRVRPAGIGARLDIRSRSRESVSDFGRNAARIRAYLKRLGSS